MRYVLSTMTVDGFLLTIQRSTRAALPGMSVEEVVMKFARRIVGLVVATLLALTLQIASTGPLFTPVPIPRPADTHSVSLRM